MRKMTYAVVAIASVLAVSTWSAPSRADMNGPIRQNGQCWHNQGPQGLGYWSECPKPAAATTPTPTRHATKGHHS